MAFAIFTRFFSREIITTESVYDLFTSFFLCVEYNTKGHKQNAKMEPTRALMVPAVMLKNFVQKRKNTSAFGNTSMQVGVNMVVT